MRSRLLVVSLVTAIAGCTGPQGEAGASGASGNTSLVKVSVVPADPACLFGGVKIDVGLDDDGDGTLDAAEIDQTQFVCNGAQGAAGDAGNPTPGPASLLNISTSAPDATCVTGGLRVDSGLDDDGDGTLDAAEIDQTRVVCHGTAGDAGAPGPGSLLDSTATPPDATCPTGGVRIDVGLDDDGDGTLDAAEIDQTRVICNGAAGDAGATGAGSLINSTTTAPDTTCPTGGVRIDVGLDDDGDGTLDAAEIDQTQLVCNGAVGAGGDAGPAGLRSLVSITTQAPDLTCATGGTLISSGVDDDSDGTLEPAEVDHSQLVCNGAPPPPPCSGPWKSLQYDAAMGWRCVDLRSTGLSQGNANGFELIDAWGDAWDGTERATKTWADANADCTAKGGRLPTATELFRNNAASGTGVLGSSQTLLWSLILDSQAFRVVVRVSNGDINSAQPTNINAYRCIWPNRVSAAFDGDACYGPAGTECQGVRRWYNMDTYVRPALDEVAASHECNFYNASLPTVEDWTEIAHTNGSALATAEWQWTNDAIWYTSSPYVLHPTVRWDTANAAHFAFSSLMNVGNWSWPSTRTRFRCIGKRQASEGVDPLNPACTGSSGCFTLRPHAAEVADKASRRSPIWADQTNRTAATRDVASEQCRLLGGALPTTGEFQELIHAGLPFAAAESDAWLWVADGIYDGGNTFSAVLRRNSGWTDRRMWYPSGVASFSYTPGTSLYAYRCVWHQTHRATPFTCGLRQDVNYDGTQYSCADRSPGDANGNANGSAFTDAFGNTWDSLERTSATFTVATASCQALGARLPTGTELWRVRSNGPTPIPNSTPAFLWTRLPSHRLNYAVTERASDGSVADNCTNGPCNQPYRCVWPASAGTVLSNYACSGPTSGSDDPCWRAGRFTVDEQDRAPLYAASAVEECKLAGGWVQSLRGFEELTHAGIPNGTSGWSWLSSAAYHSTAAHLLLGARWTGVGNATWQWGQPATNGVVLHTAGAQPFRCVFHDFLR